MFSSCEGKGKMIIFARKKMNVISYHIFMFPFKLEKGWSQAVIDKMLSESRWEREIFKYENGDFASNFSEQGYFYMFSSEAIFDEGSRNQVITTYCLPLDNEASYTINVNKRGLRKSYVLKLEKVEMNVYDGKAAILSFHLSNDCYSELQDILNINDFGRRIYPQYLVNDNAGNVDLQNTKNVFLADSIELKLGKGTKQSDDFSHYVKYNEPPYTMPYYIKALLPEKMRDCWWLLDDRMYVVSYFSSTLFSDRMRDTYGNSNRWMEKGSVEYDWYRYVYIDNEEPRCRDEEVFRNALRSSTNTRWSGNGLFYGVTRYSFSCLIGNDGIGLLRNIKTMYYRMTSLVLAQRVLLLYYSKEIADISKKMEGDIVFKKELRRRVNVLNRDYLRFVNNIYFREITPQDFGIELYDMMQKQMNIKRDEEGLSMEIDKLFQYLAASNDEKRNSEAGTLNWIATLFLVPTLITGIWGMNIDQTNRWYWSLSGVALGLAAIIIYLLIVRKRRE